MNKYNIVALLFILFILYICFTNGYEKFTNNFMILSEGHNPVCSMSCCHYTWPIDHIDKIPDGYEPTNIMCDNGYDTGCMCKKIEHETNSDKLDDTK